MEFKCSYSRESGETVYEVRSGQNVGEVRQKLEEQGFLPLSIKPRWSLLAGRGRRQKSGFSTDEFIHFNQQFVALIRAGLPILRSLDILTNRITNDVMRSHIESVRIRVVSGMALSDALEQEKRLSTCLYRCGICR